MARAQSAMEYVTSYGWAIIIIALVVGLLFYFATLPQHVIPNTCQFNSGVTCADLKIGTDTATGATNVSVYLNNQLPYEFTNPKIVVSIGGVNQSAVSCTPSNVYSGNSILCNANAGVTTQLDQYLSGALYLTVGDCGLVANYLTTGVCVNPPTEIFTGSFAGHTETLTALP